MALLASLLAVFVFAALLTGVAASLAAKSIARATSTGWLAGFLMAPAVAAASVCLAMVWPGLLEDVCHCLAHGLHHPHLCLRHPGYAPAVLLPAGIVACLWAALALPRLSAVSGSLWQTWVWVRRVARAPVQVLDGVHFRLIDAPGLGACTTGLFRPLIAVDAGLWRGLGEEERRAILHHESAHCQRLDPLTIVVLEVCAALALVFGARDLMRQWRARVEEECDRHAAELVGAPETVASALLNLERYHRDQRATLVPALVAGAGGVSLERRVRLLLDRDFSARPANLASDVRAVSLVGLAFAVAFTFLGGDLVHHGAELVLGFFARPL